MLFKNKTLFKQTKNNYMYTSVSYTHLDVYKRQVDTLEEWNQKG